MRLHSEQLIGEAARLQLDLGTDQIDRLADVPSEPAPCRDPCQDPSAVATGTEKLGSRASSHLQHSSSVQRKQCNEGTRIEPHEWRRRILSTRMVSPCARSGCLHDLSLSSRRTGDQGQVVARCDHQTSHISPPSGHGSHAFVRDLPDATQGKGTQAGVSLRSRFPQDPF